MAEKAINEESVRQQDYIIFLGQVLNVCITFKKKLDSGYKRIFFREKNVKNDWYSTQGYGWGNYLFRCVYESIVSGTKSLVVCQSKEDKQWETIDIKEDLSITPGNRMPVADEDWTENRVYDILNELQKGYIDDGIIDRLISQSSVFFQKRHELLKKESVFHLVKTELEDYLEAFYNLLVSCIVYHDILDARGERDTLIDILLHLDSVFDEASGKYLLSFWNPIILNKLQKISDGVELFFHQITEGAAIESDMMQRIYRHTLLTKAKHSLRWYISGRNRELLYAAIAPYVEKERRERAFQIIAGNPQEYNSYEGIGELRLGEKIVYEYELLKEAAPRKLCVAIMGDLDQEPLVELGHYVSKALNKRCKVKPLLQFNIYTKNQLDKHDSDGICIMNCGCTRDVLLDKDKLSKVIEENHVVFILDCVELYTLPKVLEPDSLDFVKQKYAFSTFDEYNTGLPGSVDVCDYNALDELYEIVTCKQCFNQYGRIAKLANGPLLAFCEAKQKERGRESAIYIYVSDLLAFNSIYNDDQYYIRTERYNQKEIGIIRYSSEQVSELALDGEDKMLVFNMWQFIKNVSIDERNMFDTRPDEYGNKYPELNKIYIGIDYADWPNLLVVHYYCEEEEYVRIAVQFIEDILLPILNNRSRDMYNVYIRKAMYSFFYSSAKSVNDMLFIHLFQDKEELLGKAILSVRNDHNAVKRNRNFYFKYSSKRFYDMIIKNYDMSSSIYVGQLKTSQIIHKNELKEGKIDKKRIYTNVIEACKNLSYDKGYLVRNCKREI